MIVADRMHQRLRGALVLALTAFVVLVAIALSLHAAVVSSLPWFIASIGVMVIGCACIDRIPRKSPPTNL